MRWSTKIARHLAGLHWAIGFVRGGMAAIMESDKLEMDWVKMPKDRWFADPFVLEVTDKEILLLVEDMPYDVEDYIGRISLLHINRTTMEISSRKVLLDTSSHLSFPSIWRHDGHIYVAPENAHGGCLELYEYNAGKEELRFVQTICEDAVWDSVITDAFGEPLLFTAFHDDYHLDIYRWDATKSRYVPYWQIVSEAPNSRMGGAVFEYKGAYYYPAQDCSKNYYGGAIDIKKLKVEGGKLKVAGVVKHIESPNPKYPLGLHTLNEHKGVVVVDVRGYCYGRIGALMSKLVKCIKK